MRLVWLVVGVGAIATPALACNAPGRLAQIEDCKNGIDDDGNGAVDCNDSDCALLPGCAHEVCGNNIDDDYDGKYDCADPDCGGETACGAGGRCGDGMLGPGEICDGTRLGGRTCITQGFVAGTLACLDCQLDASACTHTQPEICNNSVDDDQDGMIDCTDSDCAHLYLCTCGNHVLDDNEYCDGELVPAGMNCVTASMGQFSGGTLGCEAGCAHLELSGCTHACGDGSVNPGETCDDGNTVAGDGCDATCQVEPAPLCAAAELLAPGTYSSTTDNGTLGFQGSCVGAGGHERVFSFTPATSGTLEIELASAFTDQGLYLRSTCADASTEIACAPAGNSATLSRPVSAGVPLAVFVDGTAKSAAGPFTLTLTLTP